MPPHANVRPHVICTRRTTKKLISDSAKEILSHAAQALSTKRLPVAQVAVILPSRYTLNTSNAARYVIKFITCCQHLPSNTRPATLASWKLPKELTFQLQTNIQLVLLGNTKSYFSQLFCFFSLLSKFSLIFIRNICIAN